VITTDSSDWATNCPEYKVTAVQVMPVSQPSEWQQDSALQRVPSSSWREDEQRVAQPTGQE
jgi:predicted molibdopterin-dependent oxidoreductase YjgC